ncbi:hypothetical protein AD006_25260 [Pseudonocardia sp. EC080610-09]|nr:hypothetical protein FRP1_17815 [Pseudonocardia sp. EC080625-04]ALL77789.1 hypothetical protein AD006_25260 [Pseudonocardia sp. EC080610-09]ALL80704.1 hypothetical protein AD017_04850 [Pseudonocardia sp. EC080619-01]
MDQYQARGDGRDHRVLGGLLVAVPAGRDLLRFERGVQQGHRLLNAERHVQEGHVVPGGLARLRTEFSPSFRARVRLTFKSGGVQVVLGGVAAPGMAEGGGLVPPVRVTEVLVARVEEPLIDGAHVLGIDEPGEAELLGSRAPPAPRWLPVENGAGVVALAAGRDLLEEVLGAIARGDAQHQDHPETIMERVRDRVSRGRQVRGRPEAGTRPRIVMHRCAAVDLDVLVLRLE